MATKKDLVEAQGFSRLRLLSAFTGGAPGGKELEPAKPLRAVVAGVGLTAALLLAGVFVGLISPSLPQGWENDRLILVEDTGARYVSSDGVLHPVANTASARLLIDSGSFDIVTLSSSALDGIEVGAAVGIVGAPDDLPDAASLVADGWSACVADDGGTAVHVGGTPRAGAAAGGSVVTAAGATWVLADGTRHLVDPADASAVLRAAGVDTARPVAVESAFLALFDEGAPLAPLVIAGAGGIVTGAPDGAPVGSVLHAAGSPEDERYVLQQDGTLAALSPLGYRLYLLGTGAGLDAERTVQFADFGGLATRPEPAEPADWPDEVLDPLDGAPCALLESDGDGTRTVLAERVGEAADGGVSVDRGAGALVTGSTADGAVLVRLVDERGTAYPIPAPAASATDAPELSELLARLGYSPEDVAVIDDAWLAFFAAGPSLTPESAGSTPTVAVAGGAG